MNQLTNIDDLRDIFFEDGKHLWRLYSGRTAKGAIIGYNKEDDNPESSWEKLESRIMMYGSGNFAVAVMEKYATNNTQATIHLLKLGNGQQTERTGSGFGSNLSETLMLLRFMDERSNRNQASVGEIYDEVSSRVKLESENERLKQEIKQLKGRSTATKVAEVAFTKLPRIIDHYFPEAKGIAGEMGYDDGPTDNNETSEKEPTETYKGNRSGDSVDFNVLVNAASIAAREIPGINVNQLFVLLVKLAISIEKANPPEGTMEIINKLHLFIEENPDKALDALAWLK